MKMYQLFTGIYSDRRTAYEKPLEWIYANQNGASVEIRPTIWVWMPDGGNIFLVDYVGASVGCTLGTFNTVKEANAHAEKIGQMEESDFEEWLINIRWKSGYTRKLQEATK